MHKGFNSSADFVVVHTILTVSSIVDVAAPAQIAPHLPNLIAILLISQSALESSAFEQVRLCKCLPCTLTDMPAEMHGCPRDGATAPW
jgi:hypothetical protein